MLQFLTLFIRENLKSQNVSFSLVLFNNAITQHISSTKIYINSSKLFSYLPPSLIHSNNSNESNNGPFDDYLLILNKIYAMRDKTGNLFPLLTTIQKVSVFFYCQFVSKMLIFAY
jgi:hypothetical protein